MTCSISIHPSTLLITVTITVTITIAIAVSIHLLRSDRTRYWLKAIVLKQFFGQECDVTPSSPISEHTVCISFSISVCTDRMRSIRSFSRLIITTNATVVVVITTITTTATTTTTLTSSANRMISENI